MRRRTRDQWFEIVGKWKASGLCARQFAKRHGISPRSLLNWSSKLRRQGRVVENQPRDTTPPSCVEIIGTTTAGAVQGYGVGWLEVELTEPVRIRASEGFPPEKLVRLLEER